MTQWEYYVRKDRSSDAQYIQDMLNDLGSRGWELIVVDSECYYYFKRPIPAKAETTHG